MEVRVLGTSVAGAVAPRTFARDVVVSIISADRAPQLVFWIVDCCATVVNVATKNKWELASRNFLIIFTRHIAALTVRDPCTQT